MTENSYTQLRRISVAIGIPERMAIKTSLGKHRIQQIGTVARRIQVEADLCRVGSRAVALRFVDADGAETWIARDQSHFPDDVARGLRISTSIRDIADGAILSETDLAWVRPHAVATLNPAQLLDARESAAASWPGRFHFRADGEESGLRTAQSGALHALLSHWTISDQTALVVMPTGTGKTETMLAAVASQGLPLVLVAVPSRALRSQLTRKFATFGVLPSVGVLSTDVELPVVATLLGAPNASEVTTLMDGCNVIVATMASLARSPIEVQELLARSVDLFLIDEAHHVPARTWSDFREAFKPHRVAHFTATPFRGDGKLVPGKPIYRYPLKKAQEEGYFTRIRFRPVLDFDPQSADRSIALAALQELDEALEQGLDHIVMARVETIRRAEEVAAIYRQLTSQTVTVVHSDQTVGQREAGLLALETRSTRLVVCVDMLGEGYDLPSLKIAALHDCHRGLGITLQFVGRFTRAAQNIGEACAIANIADPKVEDVLEQLYSQDADWNALLRSLNDGVVAQTFARTELIDGFQTELGDIPVQNLRPKMSAVVFRCQSSNWRPARAVEMFPPEELYDYGLNPGENLAFLVTRRLEKVPWGDVRSVTNVNYDLLLLYFDESRRLLFVHSSDTRRLNKEIAEAACGASVELIQGMEVFRVLSGINRLVVANMGLKHALGRSVRFTMYAGANVNEGLTEQHFQNRTTSNLFGFGYEGGDRASAGCSYKGRLWSYRVSESLSEWVEWCQNVGSKLIDDSIDPQSLLRTTMTMTTVTERPPGLVPIGIEWSENVWIRNEDALHFVFGADSTSLLDVGLRITSFTEDGPIRFQVFSSTSQAEYEIMFGADGINFGRLSGPEVSVRTGQQGLSLSSWFDIEPPVLRFHNGQQLVRELLFSAPSIDRPFSEDNIDTWDWSGVDKSRESQGPDRNPASIQRRVVERLLEDEWDIVFDDDDTNEAADVVAIRADDNRLSVGLYHCKYAIGGTVGNRVADLYELCGQVQRSVHWKGDRLRLLDHLGRREGSAIARGRTRFERGNLETLNGIARRARLLEADFAIVAVQPGLSKQGLTDGQRDLLATTQLYLAETFAVPFRVVASP